MRRTPVYIICSPRPLVGKTLIARLLSEFLLLKNGAVAAFDINLKEPSLLDYLPRSPRPPRSTTPSARCS
jgi:hypothetical protein